MPKVSVIMLSLDKRPYTEACLESFLCTEGAQLEVIVVDNGSTDGSLELLERMAPEFARRDASLRWRANASNLGCCTGRNQGLAMATGDYCVFADNDVLIADADWAPRLIAVLDEEPRAAIVGPKLTYPFPPHRIQCAGVGVSRSGRVQFRGRNRLRDAAEYGVRRDCQCLISAFFLFPRWLYDEIGGLDEAFNPIEFEDFDWCYRARERGHRVIYEPSVEVHHWESITSDGTARLPNTYLIVKHGMLFKRRWRHMFENEDGPPDDQCRWERIEVPSLHGRRKR